MPPTADNSVSSTIASTVLLYLYDYGINRGTHLKTVQNAESVANSILFLMSNFLL